MLISDLITSALRSIGAVASGETPSTDEMSDGFVALNAIVGSLSAEGLAIPYISVQSFTLLGNGAVGSFTTRPIRVMAATVAASGYMLRVKVVDSDEFARNLGTSFEPQLWCDYGPTASLAIRPIGGLGGLTVYYTTPLIAFASQLVDTASAPYLLPPGYDRALMTLLAQDLALQYFKPLDQGLAALAAGAKMAIEGLNKANLGSPVPAGQA